MMLLKLFQKLFLEIVLTFFLKLILTLRWGTSGCWVIRAVQLQECCINPNIDKLTFLVNLKTMTMVLCLETQYATKRWLNLALWR